MTLLVPTDESIHSKTMREEPFSLHEDDSHRFHAYMKIIPDEVLLLRHENTSLTLLGNIRTKLKEKHLFVQVTQHVMHSKSYQVDIEEVIEDQHIVHFKHIEIGGLDADGMAGVQEDIEAMQETAKNNKRNSLPPREGLYIHKVLEHYYLPLIYRKHKKHYKHLTIKNIIDVDSEVTFIRALIETIGTEDFATETKHVEKWYFSKLVDRRDKVYIPYRDKKENKHRKFYPDFIFWIKEKDKYRIVFVDPKGKEHADYQLKVDGYKKLFEEEGALKTFVFGDLRNIQVALKLYGDKKEVAEGYESYWVTSIRDIFVSKPEL